MQNQFLLYIHIYAYHCTKSIYIGVFNYMLFNAKTFNLNHAEIYRLNFSSVGIDIIISLGGHEFKYVKLYLSS